MKQYQELVRTVLELGSWQDNRTGIPALSMPGAMMRFDLLKEGFPAITTKKLAFKSVVGELCAFLRASQSAADFRALGCKVWDQNANENKDWLANPFREGEDHLGPVYGYQWRKWPGYKQIDAANEAQIALAEKNGFEIIARVTEEGVEKVIMHKAIDQLKGCLDTIINDPGSRRILFHAWNPAELDAIALPACHLLYQFIPNKRTKELSLVLYLRSNDLGLGTSFNQAEAALLLHIFARLTGYTARWLTYFIGDAHIYENHLDMVQEQLKREPFPSPKLVISDRIPEYAKTGVYQPEWLEKLEPSDFSLEGYVHHAPLTAPMAV